MSTMTRDSTIPAHNAADDLLADGLSDDPDGEGGEPGDSA
jgi:hypothetical protein